MQLHVYVVVPIDGGLLRIAILVPLLVIAVIVVTRRMEATCQCQAQIRLWTGRGFDAKNFGNLRDACLRLTYTCPIDIRVIRLLRRAVGRICVDMIHFHPTLDTATAPNAALADPHLDCGRPEPYQRGSR